MVTKVAINGFGRIGRSALKVAFERKDLEVVAVNDLADVRTLAYLLKHDSVFGTYHHDVDYEKDKLIVDGKAIEVFHQSDPGVLPWGKIGVDVVIESTGLSNDPSRARAHIDQSGARKVVIASCPEGSGAGMVILGVNEAVLEKSGDVISIGSDVQNCVAPIIDVLRQDFGVEKVVVTSVHSQVSCQSLQDKAGKDLRLSRSATNNIVPVHDVLAKSISEALPELEGRYDGLTVFAPNSAVSLADITLITAKDVSVEDINDCLKKASGEPYYQGILAVTDVPLVSSDFIGNSHSAIVDLSLTSVVGGNMVKVMAWHDNEWAYANRLVETTADLGALLGPRNIASHEFSGPEEAHL